MLWDGFRWKPDVLGGVGTCLGWVLNHGRPRMSKKLFWLHPYVCMHRVCRHDQAIYVHVHYICVCINVHKITRTHASANTRIHEACVHIHLVCVRILRPRISILHLVCLFCFFFFFDLFFVQNDSYAPIFVFYRVYSLARIGVVPATYSFGVKP